MFSLRLIVPGLVLVVASAIPMVAAAQPDTAPVAATSSPSAPVVTAFRTATTRRTGTTARRATTTVATTAPTTEAPTTVATTAASTIPPTTLALVTTPSVAAAQANDTSSTRTVDGVILGLLVVAGLVALLTVWFYRRTAPLPASLEVLEFMGRRKWRRAPDAERTAQLAALRSEIGEVPPENIVNLHPVPVERPPWRPSEVPDESVADALVGLVPPPEAAANGRAPVDASAGEAHADRPADDAPADVPTADHGEPAASVTSPSTAASPPSTAVSPAATAHGPADTLDPHG